MRKETFKLFHVALYAKHWYKRENKKTIWEDLQVILDLDGYYGEGMNKGDIVGNILNHCQRLDIRAFKDLSAFANGISKDYCWRHGYYTQDHTWAIRNKEVLPEYDYYEAIVRYCLSNIQCADIKELCGVDRLPMPDYKKGLPRKNGITDKKLKEFFGEVKNN
jgi:hypothetical protein